MTLPGPLVLLSKLLLIAGLGAAYLLGLRLVLRELSLALATFQPWPIHLNISVAIVAALAAGGGVFAFNRFVTQQYPIHLGICCSVFAFAYFIVVRGWLDLVSYLGSVLATPSRLLSMMAFIGLPLLLGFALRKWRSRGIDAPTVG